MNLKISVFALFFLVGLSCLADHVSLYLQNDVFYPSKSDKYYTHGTRVEYGRYDALGFAAGQYMYTADVKSSEILEGERPYCGWLYGAVFKDNYRSNYIDSFELRLGAIGDYSYAEKTQKTVHKWTGSQTPVGWDNQIVNEFGANLDLQEKYSARFFDNRANIIPQIGCSVGNVYVGGNVGTSVLLGFNVPREIGIKSIEPCIMNIRSPKYFYVFGRFFERLVLHNITLDGSLFNDDSPYTVDSEKWVSELEYGICLGACGADVKFSFVNRTDEFVGQTKDESFGALTLSYFY